jgi:SsrA-binding protein
MVEREVKMASEGIKVIAENRKAFHDYFIEERIEAGIILTGTEIKSVRNSRVNLKDSYARIENGEVWLYQMHISPYEQGNRFNHDPLRKRKLLLHHSEIVKLIGKIQLQGLTLIPLKIYLKHGLAKIELAVGRGKKNYDKRQDMAEKDAKREIERHLRDRNKY